MDTFKRFAASLLPFLVLVLTAFTVIPEAAYVEPATWIQFASLLVANAVALVVPLADSKWRGLYKTGGTIIVAILGAVLTFIVQGEFTVANVVLVVIAGLSALASEIGVQVRTAPAVDTAKHAL